MDASDLTHLQHLAEKEMEDKMQYTTSASEDESVVVDELQEEVEMLKADPEGAPEILGTKTRGRVIDFRAAEQELINDIKEQNRKANIDPMEIEDVDEEYVEE